MGRQLSVVVVGGFLLAACSSSAGGTPVPTPPSTPAASLSPPIEVTQLDLDDVLREPCSLLTPDIRRQFQLMGPGEPDPAGVTGPDCSFLANPVFDPVVVVGVNTVSGGLEGLYQRRRNFAVFDPTTVAGYPALFLQPVRDAEGCSLNVGVADDRLISVDVRAGLEPPTTAESVCDLATKLSLAIVSRLS